MAFLTLLWVSDEEPREVCILSDSLSALNVLNHLFFKPLEHLQLHICSVALATFDGFTHF